MTAEILSSIRAICERLNSPLSSSDISAGWSDARRLDVLKYFQQLERDVSGGIKISYIPLGRTLDSVGISEGDLLEDLFRFVNKINEATRN